MHNLRSSSRMASKGFISKFSNTAGEAIEVDEEVVMNVGTGASGSVECRKKQKLEQGMKSKDGEEAVTYGEGKKREVVKRKKGVLERKVTLEEVVFSSDDDFVDGRKIKIVKEVLKEDSKNGKAKGKKLCSRKKVGEEGGGEKQGCEMKNNEKDGRKGKGKGKKGSGTEENDEDGKQVKKFQTLSTRMSPNKLSFAINTLSNEQRDMVRGMGFGAFLDMRVDTLPRKLSYYLVDRFRVESSSIMIKSKEIKISTDTVEAIFGLPNGGLDFKTLPECEASHPLIKEWKEQFQDGKFNNGNYLREIRRTGEANELFKLNFLTLFINTFAETDKMGSCRYSFLEKLIQCNDISKINWCEYIVDCLAKSKLTWRQNDKNCYYTGPVSLLMLAYADRVVYEELRLKRIRPFITELDSEHLRTLEDYETSVGEFGTLALREDIDGVFYDDKLNENQPMLPSAQVTCAALDRMYSVISEQKRVMEATLMMGLAKFAENEHMNELVKKMQRLFSGSIVNTASRNEEAMDIDNVNVKEKSKAGVTEDINNIMTDVTKRMGTDIFGNASHEIMKTDVVKTPTTTNRGMSNGRGTDVNIESNVETPLVRSVPYSDQVNLSTGKQVDEGNTSAGKQQETEVDQVENKEKRKTKAGPSLCSPYVKRVVDIRDKVEAYEQNVAKVILALAKDESEVIWETFEGYGMRLEGAITIANGQKIHPNVIDCWSALLNKSEEFKAESSCSRMFFQTDTLTHEMMDERKDEVGRYNIFQTVMRASIVDISGDSTMKNVDLVFFPIVEDDKYYLVCFNLKRHSCVIIDHKMRKGSMEKMYGKTPRILKQFFCEFLNSVGNKKARAMVTVKPMMLKMKCQKNRICNEGGIYLMRHMESFMGDETSKWDCGLGVESKTKESFFEKLRYKYLSKMMLSDFNILKPDFEKEYRKFIKVDKKAKITVDGEG